MPVPGFLASIADKAQNAINASPLAGHLPSHGRPSSPDPSGQPLANEAAQQGNSKSHTFESIHHQLRTFGQQYSTTTPVQKIITAEKGVAIDFDSVARDSKAQSKELYTWGQTEADDVKDVTDRLAYLNFVQGSLAASLSNKLNAARGSLKLLRNAESNLAPRRNLRAGLQTQLTRTEHDQLKGYEKKVAELKDQIRKAESDDQASEHEVDILMRKAIRESEQLKWEAVREYGEKLVLLSQAATPIITALPSIPPTPNVPYSGAQATGAARASLQRALDNYKTGHINLPPQITGSDLSRSDTRSFGESHASELSKIDSDNSTATRPITSASTFLNPASTSHSLGHTSPVSSPSSPPINPHALNQSPAMIPSMTATPPVVSPDPSKPALTMPAITPTVAETGVPVSAGPSGPGPASGSLHDIKSASSLAGPRSGGLPVNEAQSPPYGQKPFIPIPPIHESAEDEKRRLEREERERILHTGGSGPSGKAHGAAFESADDEKKRLEREERERLLNTGAGSSGQHQDNAWKEDEELPPYKDV